MGRVATKGTPLRGTPRNRWPAARQPLGLVLHLTGRSLRFRMTAAPSFVETVPEFAGPVGSRKSNRTGRLVRIEQLQDAHPRDGVVRHLPAGAARATLWGDQPGA
jgi:hypothetical protein